jgi:hypothetical protein
MGKAPGDWWEAVIWGKPVEGGKISSEIPVFFCGND